MTALASWRASVPLTRKLTSVPQLVNTAAALTCPAIAEAWSAFFGQILEHSIETGEFLASDAYWEPIR